MKRIFRRSFSILVGLILGWTVAGMMLGESVSLAEEGHDVTHAERSHAGHGHDDHVDQHEGGHGGHEKDLAADAAGLLIPQASDMTWYGTVLGLVGGFFLAAGLLGYPVTKMGGQEPPDPAADPSHDDHAH